MIDAIIVGTNSQVLQSKQLEKDNQLVLDNALDKARTEEASKRKRDHIVITYTSPRHQRPQEMQQLRLQKRQVDPLCLSHIRNTVFSMQNVQPLGTSLQHSATIFNRESPRCANKAANCQTTNSSCIPRSHRNITCDRRSSRPADK